VLWSTTPKQSEPWLKHRSREILFRESIIAFIGAEGKEDTPEHKYCKACRELGEDDCQNCEFNIEVINGAV